MRTRDRFYLCMTLVLAAIVLVGMALLTPIFVNSEWRKAVVWAVS